MIRLNKVLKDLNIGLKRAQDFIYDTTGEQLGNKNSKITQKVSDLLTKEFQADKSKKKIANELRKERQAIAKAKRDAVLEDIETARNGYKPKMTKLKVFFEKYNLIKSRTNEEWLKSSEQIIIDAYEKMINIQKSDRLFDYKIELRPYLDELYKGYPSIKKNFHLAKKLSSVDRMIKDMENEDNQERRSNISNENFTWGGLSGDEAELGYWNTD